MPSPALIAMAKSPTAGTTKTRLAAQLGFEAAAGLYECFLLDTLDSIRSITNATPMIAIWPADAEEYFRRIAPDFLCIHQIGDSLGQRLDHVLAATRALGHDHAIAINTDSPTLPLSYLRDATEALRRKNVDVVLGPADDGGYYLIGVKSSPGRLVTDVSMSNPDVLRNTLAVADELHLSVSLLDPWYDIDEPADLARLRADLESGSGVAPRTHTYLDSIKTTL